jgi:peptide/nickel transport system permease protein
VGTVFSLFAGSTITETVFAWNGIGKVLIDAINSRDTMLVTTMNTFFALISVIGVLVSDITYGLIDPRIRLE